MSEREKLITIANVIDECYVSAVYEKVMSYLAEIKQIRDEEDARDLKTAYETLERIENGEEELISIEDYAKKRGLKLNGDK
nr:hypothetical protein [Clostridia bacterium]